jgi:hypothetical protein
MIAAMRIALLAAALAVGWGCGDDDTEADRLGVGAQCESTDECDPDIDLLCLPQFKGGYCGLSGCEADEDCPEASACVLHEDGETYCFRICSDKPDCNANRDLENEANCSSSVEFVEGANGRKACVPPSGG